MQLLNYLTISPTMFGKLFGWGKKNEPTPPNNKDVKADLPFPADWTGYTSAAALLLLIPQFLRRRTTDKQWGLMLWELEKYAPVFCELKAHELLDKALRFLKKQLPADKNYTAEELVPIAQLHAARLMQGRGRDLMYFATIAALHVAADSTENCDEQEAWLMLNAQYFAKPSTGAVAWDAKNANTFFATGLPIDEQFAMIASKHPAYQPVWVGKNFAEFKAMKHNDICIKRVVQVLWAFNRMNDAANSNKGFVVLLAICAAFGVETGNFSSKEFKNFINSIFREGTILGYPLDDQLIEEAVRLYKDTNPDNDPWVFLRVLESAMMLLVTEKDLFINELLLFMNDVVTRVGVTAYRRDLITKGMSIWVYNRENGRARQRFSLADYTRLYPQQKKELEQKIDFAQPFRISHVFQFTMPSGVYGEMDVAYFQDEKGNAQVFKQEDWENKEPRWLRTDGVWTAGKPVAAEFSGRNDLNFALLPLREF